MRTLKAPFPKKENNMTVRHLVLVLTWSAILAANSHCFAHFLWLVPQNESGSEVHLFFSEGPEPDNPKLLQKLSHVRVDAFRSEKNPESVAFAFTPDQSTLKATARGATAWRLKHTYGTHGRETKNLIVYTAASVACGWTGMDVKDRVHLPNEGFDLLPTIDGRSLTLKLTNQGAAAKNMQLELQAPNDHRTLTTDAFGAISVDNISPGVYAVRCVESDDTPGNYQGEEYRAVKHYTTISFRIPDMSKAKLATASSSELGQLPEAITSFGATTIGGVIYAYGGHTGGAHSYSNDEQFNKLIRLDLSKSKQWETVAEGARVQGNALVANGSSLILVGGFTAENAKGEKSRLVSQSNVQQFHLPSGQWTDLPSLPEPRSSMDASVLDGYVYAIGGWAMNGQSDENRWHKTAWRLPLSKIEKGWEPIAAPPFERRALATAAHAGRLFVIGGMNADGSTTTETCVYEPSTDRWSTIGSIAGLPMNGFGAAATEVDGRLVVSAVDGSLQQLNDTSGEWEIVGHVPTGRFFHRVLPISNDSMAIIGGANMGVGKFRETEIIRFAGKD